MRSTSEKFLLYYICISSPLHAVFICCYLLLFFCVFFFLTQGAKAIPAYINPLTMLILDRVNDLMETDSGAQAGMANLG